MEEMMSGLSEVREQRFGSDPHRVAFHATCDATSPCRRDTSTESSITSARLEMPPLMPRRTALLSICGWCLPAVARADIPGLIASIKPSVCAVGWFNATESPRFRFRGTGFFVGDGSTVATCWHVVSQEPPSSNPQGVSTLTVQVLLPDGTLAWRQADLVTRDERRDLAILHIRDQTSPALTLDTAAVAREGTDVILMGFPIGGTLGFKHVTHRGIVASVVVSALPTSMARELNEATVSRLRSGAFEVLQLDAVAYPGNSGGPLIDAGSGRVIGVVSMVTVKAGRESAFSQPTGISYAVPVRYLVELLRTV